MKDIPAAAGGARRRCRGCRGLAVAAHVAQGADYIKIVIDLPGFDQETVDALVAAAHARISRRRRARVAIRRRRHGRSRAGVDVLTHVPLDRPIDVGAGCGSPRRAAPSSCRPSP